MSPEIFKKLLSSIGASIRYLDLAGNMWVLDDHLLILAQCDHLVHLDLSSCPKLTSLGMDRLHAKKGSKFSFLGLRDCPQLSTDCIDRLRRKFGNVVAIV